MGMRTTPDSFECAAEKVSKIMLSVFCTSILAEKAFPLLNLGNSVVFEFGEISKSVRGNPPEQPDVDGKNAR